MRFEDLRFEDFWYVVAQSEQLKTGRVLSRQLLGEWLALFRNAEGKAIALQDRCVHRHSRLSCGQVKQGQLHCPYHGWVYGPGGQVVAVPAEGDRFTPRKQLQAKAYATLEQEGFVYVCLGKPMISPFAMPHYGEAGWWRVRVLHRFQNSVTNCAENFIDIPHTVTVHPKIFRVARQQKIDMTVTRSQGKVMAIYHNETNNLGWWSHFLNPTGNAIFHSDQFLMPNVTSVEYRFGPQRHLLITSQAIPETETTTLVYTEAAFNYGLWSWIAMPFVWWTAKQIIGQDVEILKIQQEVINRYGTHFAHTPADTIHVLVESIRAAIAQGQDPRDLPEKTVQISFWV